MFCYCAEARRVSRLLTARYDAALAKAGLSAAQFETLSRLEASGPVAARPLAAQLAVDKTTLSRNLQPLVTSGLIAAKPSAEDGRSILYAVTAKGRGKLLKAKTLWQSAHDATAAQLGSQAVTSQRSLQRLAAALS